NYWPELKYILEGFCPESISPEAVLPLASCQAVKGNPQEAVAVSAALITATAYVDILDNLEEQEQVDTAKARNYADALHTVSLDILTGESFQTPVFQKISQYFIDTFLKFTAGRDRELVGDTNTIEDYWFTMELKFASRYSTACATGAMVGTENPKLIQACSAFGYHLGLALQILRETKSIWHPNGITDLQRGKITLPLLYGLQSDHSQREQLLSLVTTKEIATHAEEIKAILDKIDTKGFLVWAALKEREQALEAIKICPNSEGREILESYLNGMFGNIDELLEHQQQETAKEESKLLLVEPSPEAIIMYYEQTNTEIRPERGNWMVINKGNQEEIFAQPLGYVLLDN
ncbi:MAG: polyprenyl synthetase family protein, partial [Spirulinaceae cyanobacterium]